MLRTGADWRQDSSLLLFLFLLPCCLRLSDIVIYCEEIIFTALKEEVLFNLILSTSCRCGISKEIIITVLFSSLLLLFLSFLWGLAVLRFTSLGDCTVINWELNWLPGHWINRSLVSSNIPSSLKEILQCLTRWSSLTVSGLSRGSHCIILLDLHKVCIIDFGRLFTSSFLNIL